MSDNNRVKKTNPCNEVQERSLLLAEDLINKLKFHSEAPEAIFQKSLKGRIMIERVKARSNKFMKIKELFRVKQLIPATGFILVVLGTFFAYRMLTGKRVAYSDFMKSKLVEVFEPLPAMASRFAEYKETPVNVSPQAPKFEIAKDFSNVINFKAFPNLTEKEKALLLKNGFVVREASHDEFYPLYESNRYNFTPNFITTDSILHNYHLMFNHLLESLEKEKLLPELRKLNSSMVGSSMKQYDSLRGTEWENAAKRNVGFFAVAGKTADDSFRIPESMKNEVQKELELIEKHEGIEASPLMNFGAPDNDLQDFLLEDYSQYVPRGHYSGNEDLKRYFKSMMWYGRMTFRFKNDDETRSALLAVLALKESENFTSWEKIYEPVNFFVGKSDDIGFYQLKELVVQVYGKDFSIESLKDEEKFKKFVLETKKLNPPQINSIPVFDESIQPDREKEIKGFRFMGQRFTIDASIFQKLIYREVGENKEGSRRMLPSGLDIPAAMGSEEALKILDSKGESGYKNYPENMEKLRSHIKSLDQHTWTQNLYWGWLYAIAPMLEEKGEGYPGFMRNQAWERRGLNTYLSSFAELKHDTILYAKQVYAELGGGGMEPEKADDRGYVEPNPYVYARLVSLLNMTKDGLSDRGMLSDKNSENISRMAELALKLKNISEKELNNKDLSTEDLELIRSYGGQIEHFWLEVNKEDLAKSGLDQENYLHKNPSAVVADVATDPNGQVLEIAVGRINEILAIVSIDGKLRIASGGNFSYYEFRQPLSDRLTDEAWKVMLDDYSAPPSTPEWTDDFYVKYDPITQVDMEESNIQSGNEAGTEPQSE